jgi:hypothetical protein
VPKQHDSAGLFMNLRQDGQLGTIEPGRSVGRVELVCSNPGNPVD